MAAIQALQQWCKKQCQGYRDVNITNMTTSFRDGLAFCAILHRHRPDLIDFNSLRKENIYENNQLAFKVAETELGIPALLDAEDMVALKVPDRLSILTYVSQYYNYFHGRSPIGGMAGVKRSPSNSSEEPMGKKIVSSPVTPAPSKPSPAHVPPEPKTTPDLRGKENAPVEARRRTVAENANPRSSSCAVCGGHVHLVQRLLMDGKLYHRNCFRCKQCSSTLKSGNYKAGNDPGTFICNRHEHSTHFQNSLPVHTRSVLGENKPSCLPSASGSGLHGFESKKPGQETRNLNQAPQSHHAVKAPVQEPSDLGNHKSVSGAANPNSHRSDLNSGHKPSHCESPVASPVPSLWTPSSAKTQQAREKFFQASSPPADKTEPNKSQGTPLKASQVTGRTLFPGPGTDAKSSEKDRARNILLHVLPASEPSSNKPASSSTAVGKPPSAPSGQQPLETKSILTGEISRPASVLPAPEKPRRDPVPPAVSSSTKEPGTRVGIQTASQNRFKGQPNGQSTSSGHKVDIQLAKARGVSATEEKEESPAEWRSRLKPVANKLSSQGETRALQKPAGVHKTEINIAIRPTQDEKKPVTSPAAIQETAPSSDPAQKKKLLVPQLDVSGGWQKAKQQWEDARANQNLEVPSAPKRAVAPVRPSSPRISQKYPSKQVVSPPKLHPDYVPEEKIQREVRQIERELDRLELKGVDMEKQLRKCEGDDTEDALMVEWFKLIHEKQLLLRRESELMHKLNQQKLEEKQWDIESELRTLMSKSDSLKTPKEKTREEELLRLYVETVNDRNKIVEDLDEDRLREREEDEVLAAMIQKLDGPRNTQESEKKKNRFAVFRNLITKN